MICGHCDRPMQAVTNSMVHVCRRCGAECSARTLQVAMGYSPTYARHRRERTHAAGIGRRARAVSR